MERRERGAAWQEMTNRMVGGERSLALVGGRVVAMEGGQGWTGVRRLGCICLNARSIMNKMDEFVVLMDVLRPDVMGVTESWASAEVEDAELSISGYVAVQKR